MAAKESWQDFFNARLTRIEAARQRRKRGAAEELVRREPIFLDFGSNDYLGLRHDRQVLDAVKTATQQGNWGSGASPVLSGYTLPHRHLERALAELTGTEDSLVFSSGYACNVGTLSCIADDQCVVFSDQLNHASLIDGIRLSRAQRVIYRHADLSHLLQLLEVHRNERPRGLIVTESIFSMDGDEAPLVELVRLAERFDCGLIVDEAHATGVFGSRGGGLVEELGLTDKILLKLGTLSKALGGIGGYVAADQTVIDYLVNVCRSYLFSTAPPPAVAYATLQAVQKIQNMNEQRTNLLTSGNDLRRHLREKGWPVSQGRSPIIPLVVGSAEKTLELSSKLLSLGIYVPAIRPPTVPQETSRLRISLSSDHSADDLQRLVDALGQPFDFVMPTR